MNSQSQINEIIKKSMDLEDGETGINNCIEQYCLSNNISEDIMIQAQELSFQIGSLSSGIPLSVIQNKTKLTDHFSNDYINFKCNRTFNQN